MLRRHLLASTAVLLTAIYWAVWLFVSPLPWAGISAAVIGTGLLLTATVAVAGILLEHSRLAHKVGWGLIAGLALVALMRPLSPLWVVGVVIVGFAAMSLTSRSLGGWIRSEPPVAPVPRSAVGLALILLAAPVVSAFVTTSVDTGPLPWLALVCWTILFWYVRRLPGALALVRAGLPLVAIAGLWLPIASLIAWIVTLATAAALAWTSTTRLAIRPLIERGSRVLIPPELVPEDIRRNAGINKTDS